MEGIFFDIKRFAVHDGPGIRTTFFFKGCPLSCQWCHNPEGQNLQPEPDPGNGKIVGKPYTSTQVLKEAEKDRVFYEESGGGITFSGGEPLLQYDFLSEATELLKREGYHLVIDTTGYIDREKLRNIAQKTDMILFDLKHMTTTIHESYTGVNNELILENLKMLDEMNMDIRIRYPLIPTINDDHDNLSRMTAFLRNLHRKYPIDILPYHSIAQHKYEKFRLENHVKHVSEPTQDMIQKVRTFIEEAGFETSVGG